jgi:hypothetical protein
MYGQVWYVQRAVRFSGHLRPSAPAASTALRVTCCSLQAPGKTHDRGEKAHTRNEPILNGVSDWDSIR